MYPLLLIDSYTFQSHNIMSKQELLLFAIYSQNFFFCPNADSARPFLFANCSPSTSYVERSGYDARCSSAFPPKRITTSNHIDFAIEWRRKISRNPLFISSGFAYLLLHGFSSPLSMSLRDLCELPSLQEIASPI